MTLRLAGLGLALCLLAPATWAAPDPVVRMSVAVCDPNSPQHCYPFTSTDGSTTITTGGTAQVLFGGATPADGFKVAFPSATSGSVCWVSDTTTTPSATTPGSYPLYEQGQWSTEVGEKPAGPVYITCPLTGTVISAKRW